MRHSKYRVNRSGNRLKTEGVHWGYVPFQPYQFSNNNRLVVGSPGSGKTLMYRLVMGSQLPWPIFQEPPESYLHGVRVQHPNAGTPHARQRQQVYQSIVYDAKTEQVTRLMAHGFTPGEDLLILNPLDQRCMVWDIARDVDDKKRAQDLASLIVSDVTPSRNVDGTSKHFEETAKRIVLQVIQVLQRTNGWRLRDLIHAFGSVQRIHQLLKLHPEGGDARAHIKENNEGDSAFSTLKRYLGQFEIVAASWHAVEKRHGERRLMSLTDWVGRSEGTVLLLPDGDEYEETTRPFNRFMFKRLTKLMLSPQERRRKKNRTVFIDELPTAGKLTALPHLLTKGRDYGVMVMLGIQDIDQMKEVYGENGTNIIANACPYRAYLKSVGSNAEWSSRQIGRQWIEREQPNTNASLGSSEGQSETFNEKTRQWVSNHSKNQTQSQGITRVQQEQDAVMPGLFMRMSDIKYSRVMQGIYSHPGGRTWGKSIPLGHILDAVAYEDYSDGERPDDYVEIHRDDQILEPWNAGDLQRLGLPSSLVDEAGSAAPAKRRRKNVKKRTVRVKTGPPDEF